MFKPLNNRILVRPDPVETETASGILLAKSKEEKSVTGTVLTGTATVSSGARIAFSAYGWDEVEIDKEKLYLVSESSILGIF